MKRFALALFLCIALVLTGCGRKDVAPQAALADHIPETATKIVLQNAHNGQFTHITDAGTVAQITAFLRTVTGTGAESGKGYYEGSYCIAFCQGEETMFSMAFGDSDCFYMGDYGDGYPIRYLLEEITVKEDVIPFFSQFDTSGFQWK